MKKEKQQNKMNKKRTKSKFAPLWLLFSNTDHPWLKYAKKNRNINKKVLSHTTEMWLTSKNVSKSINMGDSI